jgi:hypothetical protein
MALWAVPSGSMISERESMMAKNLLSICMSNLVVGSVRASDLFFKLINPLNDGHITGTYTSTSIQEEKLSATM